MYFIEDLRENPNSVFISEISDMNCSQLKMLRDNINVIKSYGVR